MKNRYDYWGHKDKFLWTDEITVSLERHTGSDLDIARAAWVSTKGERAQDESDPTKVEGLLSYLMRHKHGTPFEHNSLTFLVHAPIFVWREHMRHRIGVSYNEESARYRTLEPLFYIPEHARTQVGKIGNYTFETGSKLQTQETNAAVIYANTVAYVEYMHMLGMGIAPELARIVLPVNIYSSAYVTFNTRSLMNFLELRSASNALWEIQVLADAYQREFNKQFPVTAELFVKNGKIAP